MNNKIQDMKSVLRRYLPFNIILKIMCRRNLIKRYKIIHSDSLRKEQVSITIEIKDSLKELYIELPKRLNIDTSSGKRLKNCLQLWLPHVFSLERSSSFTINFNASDLGEENILSMDSVDHRNLIPDEFSMLDYERKDYDRDLINFEKFKVNWINRKHIIFWRGSSTGKHIKSIEDLKSLQRVALCLKYCHSSNIDLKISRIVQSDISEKKVYNWLESRNIRGSLIAENKFKDYCYYPDISGNSLAWGTIRKHKMGVLIFRPNHSRYLFYYNLMKPWVHYIPINSDYSDLEKKYQWAENNLNEAVKIAYNGYIVSNNYIKNIPKYFNQSMTNYLDLEIR